MKAKMCSACRTTKPVEEFSRDASKPDGLYTRCKECKKEGNRRSEEVRAEKAEAETTEVVDGEERKTSQATANRAAILELIENHQSEFVGLVEHHRRRLNVEAAKPRWIKASEREKLSQ